MTATRPTPHPGSAGAAPRWGIGQFSRMTLLSARRLRHYEAIGLLSPSSVDPFTGYRYYTEAEILPATAVRCLREAGLGLDDIAAALPAILAGDDAVWRPVLQAHLASLEAEMDAVGLRRERTLALLASMKETLMTGTPTTSISIEIRTLPARTVVAQRGIIPTYADASEALWRPFEEALSRSGARRTGEPCGATYFEDGYTERDVDVEVWEPVEEAVGVEPPLVCRAEEATRVLVALHRGPFEGFQDTYAALMRAVGEQGLTITGPCFERYVVGPFQTDDSSAWRTEVCAPIA